MNSSPFTTRHIGSTTAWDRRNADHAGERALVLGGGGSAGNAWVIGVVAGLFDAGVDVTEAELIIGTSSGSTAAAQITGATPTDLLDATLAAPSRPGTGPAGPDRGPGPNRPLTNHMERTGRIIAASKDPVDMRRRLAAAALELDPDGSGTARWRATVAARLPRPDWPERAVMMTAVDARTGEPVVFDRHSGVDLVDAVAASTAGGPPYAIADGLFIDGGYRRSSENADLAAGYRRVLVLSPLGGRSRAPHEWGMHLAAQVDELRAGGSQVEMVLPGEAALDAFGDDMMDLSRRAPAARAGYDQGRALAAALTGFWS